MFQRFLSLAKNTFQETIRQPIYGVMLLVMTLLMVLNVSLAAFTMDDDNKLLFDLGLSTLLLCGLFLAAFSATGVLSREIENKTVLTVVSKPVGRPVFILGKFVGLAGAVTIAFYLGTLVFLLAVRHGVMKTTNTPFDMPVLIFGIGAVALSLITASVCNFLYNMNFLATFIKVVTPALTFVTLLLTKVGKEWEIVDFMSQFAGGQLFIAAFLVYLAVLIATAVSLAASTRMGPVLTLLVATLVLGLGIISDYAFGQHADSSILAAAAYRFVPNVGPFWVIDGLLAGRIETIVPLSYVGYMALYTLLVTGAILSLGVALFQKREVG